MARVFVTGSSRDLGLMAAEQLAAQRHEVVCMLALRQGRWQRNGLYLRLIPYVSTIATMRFPANRAVAFGRFDAVSRHVAIGDREE